MSKDHLAKDAVIAVSLANLLLLDVWRQSLIPSSYYSCYFCMAFEGWTDLAGLLADVALLSLAVFAAIRFVRRKRSKRVVAVAETALILFALVTLNTVRNQIPFLTSTKIFNSLGWASLLVPAAVLMLVLWAILAKRRQVARAVVKLLLILSPLGIVAVVQGVWIVQSLNRGLATEKSECPESRPDASPRSRIVWIVFDEMDYDIAFARRPAGLELPELDRLRGESLFATNAFPAAGYTQLSIPSMLTGTRVVLTNFSGPNDLRLWYAERKDDVGFGDVPTVFTEARNRGLTTAAVGWFHPYCRLLGSDLCACYSDSRDPRGPQETNLLEVMYNKARATVSALPLLGKLLPEGPDAFGDAKPSDFSRRGREGARTLYESLMPNARRLAADPNFDLVLLHLPVPHAPSFYDRSTATFEVDRESGYLDSLALADRTLGELRRAMEEAGVWNDTNVLVTSDHFWRATLWKNNDLRHAEDTQMWATRGEDFRVPLYLKLAGPTGTASYEPTFNTLLSHDLVIALLDGGIASYPDLERWLDERRSFGPVEYNHIGLVPLSPVKRPKVKGA